MAKVQHIDLASLEKELPAEGIVRVLFEEVKRLRNVTASEPKSKVTKRASALLKDFDLFNDLRTARTSLTSAWRRLGWNYIDESIGTPLISRLKRFESNLLATENRLIEEAQDV